MQDNFSLEELKKLGREHWKRHRPKLFKSLSRSGDLNDSLNQAAQSTLEAYQRVKSQLKEQGYSEGQAHYTAWELVREEWLLRPSEDQPDLENPSLNERQNQNSLESLLNQKNPPRSIPISE